MRVKPLPANSCPHQRCHYVQVNNTALSPLPCSTKPLDVDCQLRFCFYSICPFVTSLMVYFYLSHN